MTYHQWVIDASLHTEPDGSLVFCPLDDDDNVVTGLNWIGEPPIYGEIVGVAHADGDEAAAAWLERNRKRVDDAIAQHKQRKATA